MLRLHNMLELSTRTYNCQAEVFLQRSREWERELPGRIKNENLATPLWKNYGSEETIVMWKQQMGPSKIKNFSIQTKNSIAQITYCCSLWHMKSMLRFKSMPVVPRVQTQAHLRGQMLLMFIKRIQLAIMVRLLAIWFNGYCCKCIILTKEDDGCSIFSRHGAWIGL